MRKLLILVALALSTTLHAQQVQKLADHLKFVEGPCWIPADGVLLFSDIPANEIKKWDGKQVTTYRKPSNNANGNTLDPQDRLVTCEHTGRRVVRQEKDGSLTVIAHSYNKKKLNSPNDVVVQSDGFVWFTDPPYGIPKEKIEQDHNYVFVVNPETYEIKPVAYDFDHPNGLCFSVDEKKLYISDTGAPRHIRVFDVTPQHTLENGKLFCQIDKGVPDGIRCDKDGNIWSTSGTGIQVFSPDGSLIKKIPVPEVPANLCFGGADGKTLFITAQTGLYSVDAGTTGATRPGATIK